MNKKSIQIGRDKPEVGRSAYPIGAGWGVVHREEVEEKRENYWLTRA